MERQAAGVARRASHIHGMWHAIFHLTPSVGEKVLRSLLIYGFLVLALRLVGKRELGQTNTMDLVVLLLVANAVQNGIIGEDNSITGAVLGAVTLFGINEAVNRTAYAWPRFARLVEGRAVVLIREGKPVKRALRRSAISLPELRAIARRQGFEHLGDVKTAVLETNGVVSMFAEEDEEPPHHPSAT